MVRRKDVSNQIVESTPKDKLQKPKTSNPELSKRRFDNQKVLTPKVDVNSKTSSNFRLGKRSSAPDLHSNRVGVGEGIFRNQILRRRIGQQ